jgi:hypothetical protein
MPFLAMCVVFILPKVSEVAAEILTNQPTSVVLASRVISRQQVIDQSNKIIRRISGLNCITDKLSFGLWQ